MNPVRQEDNRYAHEQGQHKDGSIYRDEDRQISVPSPSAPEPGIESAGPLLFDLVAKTQRSLEVQAQLLKEAIPLLNKRTKIEFGSGQTDGAGLLDLVIYRVPPGFQFIVTRLNVEAFGFSPAVPYTNAAGWIALMRSDKFAIGTMVDFLPNPPVANGAILPASITDGVTEAGVFRGGESIGFHINAGPATTDIFVRLQGIEEPL